MAQIARLLKTEEPTEHELKPSLPGTTSSRPRNRSVSQETPIVMPDVPMASYKGVASSLNDEYQPELVPDSSPKPGRAVFKDVNNENPLPLVTEYKVPLGARSSGWAPVGAQEAVAATQTLAPEPTALASSPITELLLLAEQLRAERARNERAETELARLRTEAQDAMIDAARAEAKLEGANALIARLEKDNERLLAHTAA